MEEIGVRNEQSRGEKVREEGRFYDVSQAARGCSHDAN